MENQTPSVIYSDTDIIVCNKAAGMPIQPDKTGDLNLLSLVEDAFKQKLFLINRIDRPVSGLVVLSKSASIQNEMRKIWNSEKVIKRYLAVVEGLWEEEEGVLIDRIKKGRNNKAIIHDGGKEARLNYTLLKRMDRYSLLSLVLETGRFHQVRLQLAQAGHPIKGDVKYGARRRNPDRSIHLHSFQLEIDGYPLLTAPLPDNNGLWKISQSLIT